MNNRIFWPNFRSMKRKGRAIILALIGAFLLSSVSSAEDSDAPEFLLFGMPLSQRAEKLNAREFHRYQAALVKFQHVDDCVSDAEGEPSYDFSLMRWNQLNSLEKVSVCVFRLAAELNSHEQMLNWFNANGFNAILIEQPSSVMRFYKRDGDGILVSASAPIRGPVRVGFLDRLLAHGVSVGVTFSSEGVPVDVNTTITRN